MRPRGSRSERAENLADVTIAGWLLKAKGRSIRADRPWPRNRPWRALAEDDHAEHFVLGDVFGARGADDLAVFHDRDAVGEIEHVVNVVADEENADALGLELFDEFADLRGFLRP